MSLSHMNLTGAYPSVHGSRYGQPIPYMVITAEYIIVPTRMYRV